MSSIIEWSPTQLPQLRNPRTGRVQREQLEEVIKLALSAGAEHVLASSEVRDAVADLAREFFERRGRYAEHTWEALNACWGAFCRWCEENKHRALPADSETLEAFLVAQKHRKRSTLNGYRWAVSRVHRGCGCPDPAASVAVEDQMKAIRREKVQRGERIKQAAPLRHVHLNALVELWRHSDSPVHRRNAALVVVAYETMLREAELARICGADIELHADGTGTLTVPWTKTNVSGEPDVVALSKQAVAMIGEYQELACLPAGYQGSLWVPFTKKGEPRASGGPLSVRAIDKVFRAAYAALAVAGGVDLPKRSWSGHSCRVGAAQDLMEAGFSGLQLQQAGRWKSEKMPYQYARQLLAREGAMAKFRSECS